MVAIAVVVSSSARALAQTPDLSEVFDALRADIARQVAAVRVVAWTAARATTVGSEPQLRAELQARVVLETKTRGRAHVWYDPERLWAESQKTWFVHVGEAVHVGSEWAWLDRRHGAEGGPPLRAEGRFHTGSDRAGHMVLRAGGYVMLWNVHAPDPRDQPVGAMLRAAREDDARLIGAEIEVVSRTIGRPTSALRFRRHGDTWSLVERREAQGGRVNVWRVLAEEYIDGKVWFPRRIEHESTDRDGRPTRTTIDIIDVKLDPVLAERTFTIVAPEKTVLIDEKAKTHVLLSASEPKVGVIALQTVAEDVPEPPTAPVPVPR